MLHDILMVIAEITCALIPQRAYSGGRRERPGFLPTLPRSRH